MGDSHQLQAGDIHADQSQGEDNQRVDSQPEGNPEEEDLQVQEDSPGDNQDDSPEAGVHRQMEADRLQGDTQEDSPGEVRH